MWSDRTSDDSGFTIVELVLALFIGSIIVLAVCTFIVFSLKVNQALEAKADTATWGHEALSEARWRLSSSRMILDRETGADYLPLFNLKDAPTPVAAVLPRVETTAALALPAEGVDAETLGFPRDAVGNSMLFVETLTPFTDKISGRRVDRYRFVYYFVGKRRESGIGKIPVVYDLVRFESVPYVDFTQMDTLDEEAASHVAGALAAAGVDYAWDADAPINAAFSRLGLGGLVRPPDASHQIEAASVLSAVPGIGTTLQTSGYMAISVAHNQSGDFQIGTRVPRFANAQPNGFPGGFEVLIAGPTRGRRVLLRLVLAASAGNQLYSGESMLMVAVSD